jgi:hypothetical protein
MSDTSNKNIKDLLLVLFAFVPILFLLIIVPPDMDEFVHYHALACLFYPANSLNTFQAPCNDIYLSIFGFSLPLRSYPYIGSMSSLLYAPLFYVWQSYHSARILGVFSLVGIAYGISRGLKIRLPLTLVLVTWMFPLSYTVILDTGPIGFQFFAAFTLPYLLVRKKRNLFSDCLVGFMGFIAFWNKPFFFVLTPFMLIWWILLIKIHQQKDDFIKDYIKSLFVSLITAAIFILIVFTARDTTGTPWFTFIVALNKSVGFNELWTRSEVLEFLVNIPHFAMRHYITDRSLQVMTYIFWICTLSVICIGSLRSKGTFFANLALCISVLLIYILIGNNKLCNSAHHLAFLFVPLSALLTLNLLTYKENSKAQKYFRYVMLLTLIFIQSTFYYTLTQVKIRTENEWSLTEINEVLNTQFVAKTKLYVVTDWGGYYFQSLYGDPDQAVVYIELSRFPQQISQVVNLAIKTGRSPVFIGRTDLQHIWMANAKRFFPTLNQFQLTKYPNAYWGIWY